MDMICLKLSGSEFHNRGPKYETAACLRFDRHNFKFDFIQFLVLYVCTFRRRLKYIFRDLGKRP